jgi:NADPH-dependent F420 reductase
MKIGIIGAGNIGGTLAIIWSGKGHEVLLGVRKPDDGKYKGFAGMDKLKLVPVEEAAKFSDIILLAVPYKAIPQVIKNMGNLRGKILIDCTNALNPQMTGLILGNKTSAAEKISALSRGAKVVKAFNQPGWQNLAKPDFNGITADCFICGDDEKSKNIVTSLVQDVGFNVVDCGDMKQARLIEPLAMLWIHLAYGMKMGSDMAFKLLKR